MTTTTAAADVRQRDSQGRPETGPARAPDGDAGRRPLRAGVVGAGAIARQHLGALRSLKGVETVCVCDLSAAMAEAAAERFGVGAWTASHAAMLADYRPDVVHVTTPPGSHYPIAMDALKAGCHVLVEKPITMETPQLRLLLEEARSRGLVTQESHNYMFNRPVRRVLDLVESGEFGAPTQVEAMMCLDILGAGSRFADPNVPHPLLKAPGGVMADFMTHLAYLAYIFVGPAERVRTVYRKRDASSPLPHDEFRAVAAHQRGISTLAFSAHARPDLFSLRIHGEKMRATISVFEGKLTIERMRGGPKPLVPTLNALDEAASAFGNAFGSLSRKLSGGPQAYEGLWRQIALTYEAIRAGAQPPVPTQQIEDVGAFVEALVSPENMA